MEEWKDIEGYENKYQVSNQGRVKSLNYLHTKKEEILSQRINKKGYSVVYLYKDKKTKTFSVHRLVAKAFIPNPNNFTCINHKDENKTNNCVENLEWCNTSYNNNYGEHNNNVAKALSIQVCQYDKNTNNLIAEFNSLMDIQREFGYYTSNISRCCKGKIKSAFGYIWKYKKDVV